MPYIKLSKRPIVAVGDPRDSGELSFAISLQIRNFLRTVPNGGFEGALSKVIGAIGAAEDAFMEDVYRPYEAKKRLEHGPIYDKEA